jgi:hypothetical protein
MKRDCSSDLEVLVAASIIEREGEICLKMNTAPLDRGFGCGEKEPREHSTAVGMNHWASGVEG